MTVFWDVAPCNLVEVYWHFRGAYCLHCQGHDYTVHHPRRQSSLPFCSTQLYPSPGFMNHVVTIQFFHHLLS
jgi:hypothetical protein